VNKKHALALLDCNNQELAKMLNITPSYLSRFDELDKFHAEVVMGRHAIIEAEQYKALAESLEKECLRLQKQIDGIQRALDN
tara:strand:+ start:371 stop:616 length:246 start_codon:yes stop_codon:yes gene_type:complete